MRFEYHSANHESTTDRFLLAIIRKQRHNVEQIPSTRVSIHRYAPGECSRNVYPSGPSRLFYLGFDSLCMHQARGRFQLCVDNGICVVLGLQLSFGMEDFGSRLFIPIDFGILMSIALRFFHSGDYPLSLSACRESAE